eukprot:TRINITY_DN20100_c0_g1_i7.p3 TRINITY_DN20100_c0_g1~~TRINITY_DN20100_c0_g1_i7.p3  ORF type:complete len:226 (-),score=-14.67 TRINITY_DN20100_c0_g1_i7:15-692(-)
MIGCKQISNNSTTINNNIILSLQAPEFQIHSDFLLYTVGCCITRVDILEVSRENRLFAKIKPLKFIIGTRKCFVERLKKKSLIVSVYTNLQHVQHVCVTRIYIHNMCNRLVKLFPTAKTVYFSIFAKKPKINPAKKYAWYFILQQLYQLFRLNDQLFLGKQSILRYYFLNITVFYCLTAHLLANFLVGLLWQNVCCGQVKVRYEIKIYKRSKMKIFSEKQKPSME